MKALRPLALALAFAVAGCASLPGPLQSPEAQIKAGAETVTATTTTATVLLRNQRITVTQAKSYRNMLAAAGESLKDANTELEACRTATGSTSKTVPDPCWPKVSDVVGIALENIASMKRALDSR